jgi:hypothetical protein
VYRAVAEEFSLCNLQLQMGRSRTQVRHRGRKQIAEEKAPKRR